MCLTNLARKTFCVINKKILRKKENKNRYLHKFHNQLSYTNKIPNYIPIKMMLQQSQNCYLIEVIYSSKSDFKQ